MDIFTQFPSNYLKAADLNGSTRRVVIESLAVEELGQGEKKPVVKFVGMPTGLVLNKTNARMIAATFGAETTLWPGKELELYSEKVSFQGRIVDSIRVRAVPPPAAADHQQKLAEALFRWAFYAIQWAGRYQGVWSQATPPDNHQTIFR